MEVSLAERRCLIPVTQFVEVKGAAESKTGTWFASTG
jgi:putative SOS response-associated peptidase YedK